ncbi:MAG TPA: hypothetical protein ENG78_05295, partial [Acidiferrobacteraceae bacterium]|nr:hypothetical protein [Acidiferrobacteraceae bacterium]HEX20216.1 hypothetical protein [Acidiferrobacteraceae bacterium]
MAQNYGLIRFTSNKELDEANKPESEESEEVISALASHIQKVWQVNRQSKEKIEEELLTCLRQVKGEYDPGTLTQIRKMGGSEIYMQLTAAKKRAGSSWIREIMLPAADRPWGIEPTPIPELPEWANRNIAQRLMESQDQGEEDIMQRASEMRDQVMKALKEIAEDASDRMSDKIADQLVEGGWDEAVDAFINDFTTFPAAIIKGPILRKRQALSWGDVDDDYKPNVTEEIRLEFERISPFDLYPSPDATEINDGGLIERMRFSRGQLYDLIGMKG